jgi:hypothetical protein
MWRDAVEEIREHLQGRRAQLSGHQTEMRVADAAAAISEDWRRAVNR